MRTTPNFTIQEKTSGIVDYAYILGGTNPNSLRKLFINIFNEEPKSKELEVIINYHSRLPKTSEFAFTMSFVNECKCKQGIKINALCTIDKVKSKTFLPRFGNMVKFEMDYKIKEENDCVHTSTVNQFLYGNKTSASFTFTETTLRILEHLLSLKF